MFYCVIVRTHTSFSYFSSITSMRSLWANRAPVPVMAAESKPPGRQIASPRQLGLTKYFRWGKISRKEMKIIFFNDDQGILTSETRCLNCETVTSKDEEFCDLSIDVDQNTSLTSCLRNFSSTETLCSDNKFKCDSCSSYQVRCHASGCARWEISV